MLQLTAEVKAQIADFKRLQNSASQVASIQATATDLQSVEIRLTRWVTIFPTLEPYCDADQRVDLRGQATTLYRCLQESKENFATEFNQHAALARIQSAASTLEDRTQQYWSRYAATKLHVPCERARIAKLLPHMQAAMPDIESTMADLQRLADRIPARPSDVNAFHTKLGQLEAMLQNMAGIDAQQTAFLTKLSNGKATLADMSPDLLEWCQREELAPLLKLSI